MIAHQWRQPVAVISMIVNTVLLDIALGKLNPLDVKKEMENISKQTQFLSQTIENFRNFFKPSQEKQCISTDAFFESLKDLMKAILGHHAISLVIDTSDVECLNVYKNELLQVIVNLINNAKDAIVENHQENGEISIAVFYQDSNVAIS